MINKKRLFENFHNLCKFGETKDQGLNRIAFSNEEKQARDYIKNILKKLGLFIHEDAIGNIFAVLKGTDDTLPAVCTGSHIDSVPNGGKYDGSLGVMCAIEAISCIKEQNIACKRNIILIIFSCEESSRFSIATLGSKALSGQMDLQTLKNTKDKNQISIYQAAKNFGCCIDRLDEFVYQKDDFYAFVELHIEQANVLKNIPIGIVNSIASPIRYTLRLQGVSAHSGTTDMKDRKDALACASKIILKIEKIAKKAKNTVATVGCIEVKENAMNVVASEAKLGIDIRSNEKNSLIKVNKKIKKYIKKICKKRKIKYNLSLINYQMPTKMSKKIIKTIRLHANKLGYKNKTLPSKAGHDAMNMSKIATYTGMIFIPCKNGISHNKDENINFNDAYKATKVLKNTLLSLSFETTK